MRQKEEQIEEFKENNLDYKENKTKELTDIEQQNWHKVLTKVRQEQQKQWEQDKIVWISMLSWDNNTEVKREGKEKIGKLWGIY